MAAPPVPCGCRPTMSTTCSDDIRGDKLAYELAGAQPSVPSAIWSDYVHDCQLAAESHLATQKRLTERLLQRLGGKPPTAPPYGGQAAERLPPKQDPRECLIPATDTARDPQKLPSPARERPVSPSPTSSATLHRDEQTAERLGWFEGSLHSWESDFAQRTQLHLRRASSFGEHVYDGLRKALGSSSAIVRQVSAIIHHDDEPRGSGMIWHMVTSKYFEIFCGLVITLNTCYIIHGTNASIHDTTSLRESKTSVPELPFDWTRAVDHSFLAFYIVELLLRLYAHKLLFFFSEDSTWNIFDLLLVFASLATIAMSSNSEDENYSTKSGVLAIRATRLAKLAKLLRVVRVVRAMRLFKQLQVFVDIIMGCYINLFWAVMMIVLVLLLFSIFFVQSLENWICLNWSSDANEDLLSTVQEIQANFGSVQLGMLTLGKAISGGTDWEVIYNLIAKTGVLNTFMFVSMLIFFAVVVWNIVASVFVENAIRAASADREEEVLAQFRSDIESAKELMHLCQRADIDKSGTLSREEFENFMGSHLIKEFFYIRGLDIKNARHFFELMNQVTEADEVDLEQFVGSCLRVRGAATSIDLHMLAYESRCMALKLKDFIDYVNTALHDVSDRTDHILNAVKEQGTNVPVSLLGLQTPVAFDCLKPQEPSSAPDLSVQSAEGSQLETRMGL
eukprot:TRINITY_DN8618_c0_g3_i1.p1 TRINITY_DN8618_c0_g3~~TRINITY_DN8618_c0_g3_i1.p1  ORF type:complete len:677 (-),score=127.11 TRINITY_DN8618_c0_g3_i1:238-2268(-)